MTNNAEVNAGSFVVHMVPVFQKDLAAVYKLISERNPETPGELGVIATSSNSVWTQHNLVALCAACKPVHRAIVTCMATGGARRAAVTYEDLRAAGAAAAENPEFDYDNLRGNLAWISKYMIKVAGTKSGLFVFTDRGPETSTGERYTYRMEEAIAAAWLRIVHPV